MLRSSLSGRITQDEIRAFQAQLLGHERLHPDARCLVDLSEVESSDASGTTVQEALQLAREHRQSFEGVRIAVVAKRAASFGLSRMYELRNDGDLVPDFGVFRTREEALGWLRGDSGAPG